MKIEENCCYHIYNRGNNKQPIFFHESNYDYFLARFIKYVVPYSETYAFCLMPNHFHLFLKVKDKINFEKGIKNFFISYTKSINESYGRVGGLFQGRYKRKKIDSDSYYTRVITYIHQNPKTAGMVKKLDDYKYSSYRSYLNNYESFLCKREVLNWFGSLGQFISSHK